MDHRSAPGQAALPVSEPPEQSRVESWVQTSEQLSVFARLLQDDLGRRLETWKLSRVEFSLLWACRSGGPWKQGDLATRLAVSSAHTSGLLEQMRRRGLMVPQRGTDDRRRQYWHLTPAALAVLNAVVSGLLGWAADLDAVTDAGVLQVLQHACHEWIEVLRRSPEDASPTAGTSADGRQKGAA